MFQERTIMYNINLCSSVFSKLPLKEVITIASKVGINGLELKIHNHGHRSIKNILDNGQFLKRQVHKNNLEISVLNSYCSAEDTDSIDKLIECSKILQAKKIRLVLPKTSGSSALLQSKNEAIIPSYNNVLHPVRLLKHLKQVFETLEKKARKAGVTFLFETHWGTVMSSFSSVYTLLKDFDSDYLGITFDPANMIIEGKEDWEFGIALVSSHIKNVHIKNVVWTFNNYGIRWDWSPIQLGCLHWSELIGILASNGYTGDYAIEDFLLANLESKNAILQLKESVEFISDTYDYFGYPSKELLPLSVPMALVKMH
jgi:sugar phosphate isomerase/epimerase